MLIALAAIAAARVVASFTPTAWAWGLEPFRYWPAPGMALLLTLTVAGFVPAVAGPIERALERIGRAWERSGWRGDLLVGLGVATLMFALRDPIRFTGDSMMRAGLINISAAGASRLMGYYFPIDEALNLGVPRFLIGYGLAPATGLQLVGALVGGAFAVTSIRMVRALGARGAALAAGSVVALAAGTLVHFAGYDKFGPLMLGIAIAAVGAARLSRGEPGLVALAVGTSIALLSHRSGYFIAPAAAWTLLRAWRAGRDGPARVAVGLAAVVIVLAGSVMVPRTVEVATRVDLAVHLPGGAETHSREAAGLSAVVAKLVHVPNVLTFLVPLWLAGLAAAWAARRAVGPAATPARAPGGFSLVPVFGLAFAALGSLVFAIAPGGGWPRDWDSSLGAATVLSLGTTGALVVGWSRAGGLPRTLAPATLVALAVSISLWGIHACESIALRRIERLLAEPGMWSDFTRANAYDILGANQLNRGRFERAASYFEGAIRSAPNPRYFHQLGLARLAMGRLSEARAGFQGSLERNPRMADPWVGLARVALASGDTAASVASLDSALARSPGNADAIRLGQAIARR